MTIGIAVYMIDIDQIGVLTYGEVDYNVIYKIETGGIPEYFSENYFMLNVKHNLVVLGSL